MPTEIPNSPTYSKEERPLPSPRSPAVAQSSHLPRTAPSRVHRRDGRRISNDDTQMENTADGSGRGRAAAPICHTEDVRDILVRTGESRAIRPRPLRNGATTTGEVTERGGRVGATSTRSYLNRRDATSLACPVRTIRSPHPTAPDHPCQRMVGGDAQGESARTKNSETKGGERKSDQSILYKDRNRGGGEV